MTDFIAERVSVVECLLVHENEYRTENHAIMSSYKALKATLNDTQREMLDKILTSKNAQLAISNEACYRKGFQDAIYLMSGMRID